MEKYLKLLFSLLNFILIASLFVVTQAEASNRDTKGGQGQVEQSLTADDLEPEFYASNYSLNPPTVAGRRGPPVEEVAPVQVVLKSVSKK